MNAVITGGHGFLGWHLACRLATLTGREPVRLGRYDIDDQDRLRHHLETATTVYHVAGVNRASTDSEVEQGNVRLARKLADALVEVGRPVRVVYANSIQARDDSPYGRGKACAAELVGNAVAEVGGSFANVLLPNLFGEHGRPDYNSFVATFAARIVAGQQPTLLHDKEVPLLHAQRAAQILIDAGTGSANLMLEAEGLPVTVSRVLDMLTNIDSLYSRGEIPPLNSDFDLELFNTYRSYTFPSRFPLYPTVHADRRGILFESLRYHGGTAQTYLSTTHPGATRGEHYHLSKVERFVVVKGTAEIRFRRLLHDDVLTMRVSGERPAIVDMPTLWVHNLRNVGGDELVTFFFSDELLDEEKPDQYYALVEPKKALRSIGVDNEL